jgi:Flp pilus assembly protein TadG
VPKMTNFTCNILRRLAAETRGAEIAEAAAVLPIMFMILIGIFWFGHAFSIYGTITRGAQEGARAAAAPQCATCAAGNTPGVKAYNAVQSALVAANVDPTQIIPLGNWTPPSMVDCVTGTTVTCDDHGGVCVQSNVLLSNSGTSPAVCGVSVSFEYPYRFWLPFTSLNKQSISLTASARVRMETM